LELFEFWDSHHGDRPTKALALAKPVLALLDPQGRGRQFVAVRLVQLAGTRAGGFVLTREKPAGRWGAATYSLVRTGLGIGGHRGHPSDAPTGPMARHRPGQPVRARRDMLGRWLRP
jgi:hypothetical protein